MLGVVMMFASTFYHNASDKNVMYKNITPITSATFAPTGDVNIFTPAITVDYDVNILSANYMYIGAFNRYYYINNILLQIGKKLLITGYVDVLMSFADDIQKAFVNVCRAQNPANRDLSDDKIQVNPKTYFIESNLFPNDPFTYGGNQYVIGVNGSEVTE